MQLLSVAQIHHILFQIGKIIIRKMMFIASTGIAWPFHEILTFHIMFPQAIDNDMHMNVATLIVSVCMSAD